MPDTIQTIKQNCRRCYTCVRDCPTKAIKIEDGQASVLPERCIGCGNCTIVCSQNAKIYQSGLEGTLSMLADGGLTVAMLAPSFPAEFTETSPAALVGALRQVGFGAVVEVAYGADLVSVAYKEFLERENGNKVWIATSCPAVVDYVRKYHPDLTQQLIPIVSPMVATAQAIKVMYGQEARCVFLGPCIAKKREAQSPSVPDVVSGVLTFQEVRKLLTQKGVDLKTAKPVAFDPPKAGMGRAFPVLGGLLKSANIKHDLLDPSIVVTSGHHGTLEVMQSIEEGEIGPSLVESLMCTGCYGGPGMQERGRRLEKQGRVSAYIEGSLSCGHENDCWDGSMERTNPALKNPTHGPLPLNRSFQSDDQRLITPSEKKIKEILATTNKFATEDELNCGACGYNTCREKAVAVFRGLAEETMCLPFMIDQAERVCDELKIPRRDLADIHRHIINTEKLASMGQLSAGIAHELNNPLGTILLYTHLLSRKLRGNTGLQHDLKLLTDEAQRCKKIVGALLDFAQQNRVRLEETDLGTFLRQVADDNLNRNELGERGISVRVVIQDQPSSPKAHIDRDQITQVLINLIDNAVEAMEGHQGTVTIAAQEIPEQRRVRISISDEGPGISSEDRNRIFQPFFTTKNIGKGTGLGLPISYGIVKMHQGSIWFDSEVGKGATFHIDLPNNLSHTSNSLVE